MPGGQSAGAAVDVDDHSFDEVFGAVDGKDGTGRGRMAVDGGENSASVLEKHTTHIELGRLEQIFHFVIEHVDDGRRRTLTETK